MGCWFQHLSRLFTGLSQGLETFYWIWIHLKMRNWDTCLWFLNNKKAMQVVFVCFLFQHDDHSIFEKIINVSFQFLQFYAKIQSLANWLWSTLKLWVQSVQAGSLPHSSITNTAFMLHLLWLLVSYILRHPSCDNDWGTLKAMKLNKYKTKHFLTFMAKLFIKTIQSYSIPVKDDGYQLHF